MVLTVCIVIKDLYGPNLRNDFGQPTDHTSEIVGVFTDERKAEDFRDNMLNESDYEILPHNEELDAFTTYIDGIVEYGWEVAE